MLSGHLGEESNYWQLPPHIQWAVHIGKSQTPRHVRGEKNQQVLLYLVPTLFWYEACDVASWLFVMSWHRRHRRHWRLSSLQRERAAITTSSPKCSGLPNKKRPMCPLGSYLLKCRAPQRTRRINSLRSGFRTIEEKHTDLAAYMMDNKRQQRHVKMRTISCLYSLRMDINLRAPNQSTRMKANRRLFYL